MYSITQLPTVVTLVFLATWCNVAIAQDHPCARKCVLGEAPMECNYSFTLEYYQTMSKACYSCPYTAEDCAREDCVAADGVDRAIITVNRQMPGPKIEVCLGDKVNVAVTNALFSDSATIHWHGQHQVDTPYMDGVPQVTQCPILPGDTFNYRFTAAQAGTHFYHSHSGLQRGDGMFGPLIVRRPIDQDPHRSLYDHDLSSHVLVINDWDSEDGLRAFLRYYHSQGENIPTSMLVNGKGRGEEFTDDDGNAIYTPLERFYVESQHRYRFRIISNGVLTCPIQVSVDDHMITVISTDGHDVAPTEADSLVLFAGERYDIVINANHSGGLYWMRFRGLEGCVLNSVHQLAVLHYLGASETDYPTGSTDYEDSDREGLQINPPALGMEATNGTLSVGYLSALEDMDPQLAGTPDVQLIISSAMHSVDNPLFHKAGLYGYEQVSSETQRQTPQMDAVTMEFLPFPLLSGRENIPEDAFCNQSTISETCEEEFCSCVHVEQIPLNSLVEIILLDQTSFTNHPMHIHGISYRVIGMEYLGGTVNADVIRELDESGSLIRNFNNPPLKDTVVVPGTGYTIVRFLATNPGYWFMHCHLEFHATAGMGLVLKFGEHEDMLPVPAGFPTCGNYDSLAAQALLKYMRS